jgi:hypothetical protein
MQCNYISAYSGFNIQLNLSALLFQKSRQVNSRYNANLVPYIAHIPQFTLCELWTLLYTKYYSSLYSGHYIQLNVSALQLEIFRNFDPRYTANLVSNTAGIVQFTLCELWSRLYTKYLQLHIFRLQYSAVGICAAIVHITSIQCALYCKLGAKYSAHHPVNAM